MEKWSAKGRWYAPTCVTPGVSARGHSISISISSISIKIYIYGHKCSKSQKWLPTWGSRKALSLQELMSELKKKLPFLEKLVEQRDVWCHWHWHWEALSESSFVKDNLPPHQSSSSSCLYWTCTLSALYYCLCCLDLFCLFWFNFSLLSDPGKPGVRSLGPDVWHLV